MAAAAVHTVAAAADMGENAECESISDGCVMAGSWSADEHIWKRARVKYYNREKPNSELGRLTGFPFKDTAHVKYG